MTNSPIVILAEILAVSIILNLILLRGLVRMSKTIKSQLRVIDGMRHSQTSETPHASDSTTTEKNSKRIIKKLAYDSKFQRNTINNLEKQLALCKSRLLNLRKLQDAWLETRAKLNELKTLYERLQQEYKQTSSKESKTQKLLAEAMQQIEALEKLAGESQLNNPQVPAPSDDQEVFRLMDGDSLPNLHSLLINHQNASDSLHSIIDSQGILIQKLSAGSPPNGNQDTDTDVAKLHEKINAQAYIISQLHHSSGGVKTKLQALAQENANLRDRAKNQQDRLVVLEHELSITTSLRQQLDRAVAQSVDMLNCIETLEIESDELREKVATLTKELEYANSIDNVDDEVENLKQQLNVKQLECNELLGEVTRLEQLLQK